MSTDETPAAWLRAQVEADAAVARLAVREGGTWTQDDPLRYCGAISSLGGPVTYDEGCPDEHQAAHIALHDPRDVLADCEAKLAILDLCEAMLPVGDECKDEHYQDGRDDDEIMRDEAVAELAEDILSLMADGYKHRDGWADHWACPGWGKPLREVPAGHSWAIP